MTICPYYQKVTQNLRSRALRPDYVRQVTRSSRAWCEHPHSPVTQDDTIGLGNAGSLKCEGVVGPTTCPIHDKYHDT